MTIAAKLLTADDLWNMPGNGDGYELVRGALRKWSPSDFVHSAVAVKLAVMLHRFDQIGHRGVVTAAGAGYVLHRNPDTVRAIDGGFLARNRMRCDGTSTWFPSPPDLAVEIISPTDVYGDVDEKVQEFLDAGTRLVWVVNPRHKTVTILRNDNTITALGPTDTLSGESVLPGFKITVSEIFE